ncbi:hypothetical protein [Actinoplanes xinjiangensis]|uniref:hypothetical protein n=1 Tax=Actinoplanes xinjiangensis TaxID=512350 RepID=UPI00341FCA72
MTVLWVAVPDRLPMPESIPASGRAEPGFVVAGPSDADRWVAGRDVGGWLVSNRVGSGVVCPGFAPPESGVFVAVAPDLGAVVPVPPDPVAVECEVPAVAASGLGELTFEALVFVAPGFGGLMLDVLVFVAPGFGGLMLEVLVLVAPVFIGLGCGALVFVAPGFGGLMFAVFGFGGLTFAVFVGFGVGGLTFVVFGFVGLTFAVFAAPGFAGPGAGMPDLVGPAFIGSGGGAAADRPGAGAFEALEDGVVDMGWPSAGARLEAGGPGFGRLRLGAGRRASERLRLGTLMIASHAGPRP